MKKSAVVFLSLLCAAALARATETVVLKGGKTLELAKPYVVRGAQALMTLKDGTLISVSTADIDRAATQAARRRPAADTNAAPLALSPAEAARAQKGTPKAKLKIDDSDVGHGDSGAPPDAEAAVAEGADTGEGGDAKVEVVDFDQRPSGNTLAVKGTIRNSGKAPAQNVALSVSAIDGAGKAVASTNATVASGSLEPGSSATFTASLPTAVRASTLRFVPRWSSPAVVPKAEGASPTSPRAAGSGATAMPKPAAPAAQPAPPAPPPAEKKSTYQPSPDYAPPAPNAPMSAPDDNHTGYIPGAHEETPPPPPPPPAR